MNEQPNQRIEWIVLRKHAAHFICNFEMLWCCYLGCKIPNSARIYNTFLLFYRTKNDNDIALYVSMSIAENGVLLLWDSCSIFSEILSSFLVLAHIFLCIAYVFQLPFHVHSHIYIGGTTWKPRIFSENWGFIAANWLQIYSSPKYCTSLFPQLFPIFLAETVFRGERTTRLLRLSMNRPIFRYLHKIFRFGVNVEPWPGYDFYDFFAL